MTKALVSLVQFKMVSLFDIFFLGLLGSLLLIVSSSIWKLHGPGFEEITETTLHAEV